MVHIRISVFFLKTFRKYIYNRYEDPRWLADGGPEKKIKVFVLGLQRLK